MNKYSPPLDSGIERYVTILASAGVETYESCEGGEGHSFREPTVRFHGTHAEGFRALSVAMQHDLPVASLKRLWEVIDGEPDGPTWELVFWRKPAYRSGRSEGGAAGEPAPGRIAWQIRAAEWLENVGEIQDLEGLTQPEEIDIARKLAEVLRKEAPA